MESKTTVEKLRVLLPHWIEHNHNHAAEFTKWAGLARAERSGKLAGILEQAAASIVATDELLQNALVEAGGPTPGSHDHHHNHHHD